MGQMHTFWMANSGWDGRKDKDNTGNKSCPLIKASINIVDIVVREYYYTQMGSKETMNLCINDHELSK